MRCERTRRSRRSRIDQEEEEEAEVGVEAMHRRQNCSSRSQKSRWTFSTFLSLSGPKFVEYALLLFLLLRCLLVVFSLSPGMVSKQGEARACASLLLSLHGGGARGSALACMRAGQTNVRRVRRCRVKKNPLETK